MSRLSPTPEQLEILELGLDTIRISAGAGTGKTTTVAMVIANLIENHAVEPEQILGITFTNKAASELADRVRTYLQGSVDPGREIEVHTYHGFAGQILSEFGLLAGLDRRPDVITPNFSRQLLTETSVNSDYEKINITWPGHVDRIKQLGDRLGDHLLDPRELIEADHPDSDPWPERLEMLKTLDEYRAKKRDLSVVDYADLISLSTKLVRETEGVAKTIRDRYRVVVLDEYQDTNPAQRVLLASLFGNDFPVIAVGDVDQTIYEWRGASAENFEQFPVHFSRPNGGPAHLRELTGNYRSGQLILDVANSIRSKANPASASLNSSVSDGGRVETRWSGDAMGEAEWIARRFESLHEEGTPWSEMAVLFRKNKDFPMVIEALARHEIPFEVANLGGLLSVPEIAEIRAWMRLLTTPEDPGAALHILMGSRYRLGLADLAPVSNWIRGKTTPYEEEEAEALPLTLVEGLEHLDQVDGLRPEARDSYSDFINTYRDLLTEVQGSSLVESARLILDRTRAWADIESLPPVPRLTARLNVYRFLDLCEDWSPLRGKTTMSVFLDYLTAMEEEPAEELDAARLSGEDAVSLVTVHRAKGLEWEVVAVPGVTHENFPGRAQMHPDPDRQASIIPIEYRLDSLYADMPGDPKDRTEYLREKNMSQEWRVAYVAATRAKSLLMVSGAYWYGHPETTVNPKEPSALFELVDAHPNTVSTGRDREPPRPELLRYDDDAASPDPVFPNGWLDALRESVVDSDAILRLAEKLDIEEATTASAQAWTGRLFDLPDELTAEAEAEPLTVSVTGMVTYAGCPKQFYWSEIDRLPRKRNPAAVAGTEVHRRIELLQKGNIPFEEVSREIYDTPDQDHRQGAYQNFLSSRFADEQAARVEAPFTLEINDALRVRGRIDALYDAEGTWEIVDFKSGAPSDDPARMVQLEAYTVACDEVDFGLTPSTSMSVTFAYLGGGVTEESTEVTEDWLSQARGHLEELGSRILAEDYEPTPSARCRSCDFSRFCSAGKEFLSS